MIKPVGQRVVLKCDLFTNEKGEEDVKQEANVVESNCDGIKKGDIVFFNQYGAVSVNSTKTKKNITLIVDAEDIYGIIKQV